MPIKQLTTSTRGGEKEVRVGNISTFDYEDMPKWAKKLVTITFYMTLAFCVPMALIYTLRAILEAL